MYSGIVLVRLQNVFGDDSSSIVEVLSLQPGSTHPPGHHGRQVGGDKGLELSHQLITAEKEKEGEERIIAVEGSKSNKNIHSGRFCRRKLYYFGDVCSYTSRSCCPEVVAESRPPHKTAVSESPGGPWRLPPPLSLQTLALDWPLLLPPWRLWPASQRETLLFCKSCPPPLVLSAHG